MKKVITLILAILSMMMACAGPIMTRVHAADDFPLSLAELKIKNESPALVDNCHYVFFNTYVSVNNESKTGAIVARINDTFLDNVYCEFSNNIFILRSKDFSNAFDIFVFYDSWGFHYYSRSASAIQFDFNNNSVYALDADSNYIQISGYDSSVTSCQFGNFETNFEEYDPNANSLSLDVSFKPTLSGTISRKQTIDGKEYTSTTLDMYVTNNGNDAQFAWFILPKGGSLSFPSLAEYNSQGFVGNPVFAYVSQEWTDYTEGFNGSAVLAPSSWHAIPSGYINQLYSVSWSQMMLSPNTEYDCVVYACLNVNPINTTDDPNSSWEVRRIDTVTCALNDVQEVYRSTFSISDPAEFNSSYVDEANQSYPWNPNADNSSLFNISNAYTDDTGNIVIRGQTRGGADTSSWSAWGDVSNNNMNNIFRSYFSFLNGAMNCFPKAFLQLLTLGLSGLIVLGIIKVVIK